MPGRGREEAGSLPSRCYGKVLGAELSRDKGLNVRGELRTWTSQHHRRRPPATLMVKETASGQS